MILARKSSLLLFCAFVTAMFVLISFYSHWVIINAAALGAEKLKFHSERLFFAGLAGALFTVMTGSAMILKSHNLQKALDRILAMCRNTGHSPDSGLRKLGRTGVVIADIVAELDRMGELKSLRISSLENLCSIMIATSARQALVVSTSGEIRYCTPAFAEKRKLSPGDLTGHQADAFVRDRPVMEMIRAAATARREISMDDGTIYPVMNRKNDVVFCYCLFDSPPAGISLASLKDTTAYRRLAEGGGRIRKALDFMKNLGRKTDKEKGDY